MTRVGRLTRSFGAFSDDDAAAQRLQTDRIHRAVEQIRSEQRQRRLALVVEDESEDEE